MAVSRAAADDCRQSLTNRDEGDVCGSKVHEQNVFLVRCDWKEKEAPVRMSLWLPSAQRPECRSKSARSGLSADDPGAGRKQAQCDITNVIVAKPATLVAGCLQSLHSSSVQLLHALLPTSWWFFPKQRQEHCPNGCQSQFTKRPNSGNPRFIRLYTGTNPKTPTLPTNGFAPSSFLTQEVVSGII